MTQAASIWKKRLTKEPAKALHLYTPDAEDGITEKDYKAAGDALAKAIFAAAKKDTPAAGRRLLEVARRWEDLGAYDTVTLDRIETAVRALGGKTAGKTFWSEA